MMGCEPSHLQGQGVIRMTDTAATGQHPPQPADLQHHLDRARRFNGDLQHVIKVLTGWRVWHSDAGSLYASRPAPLSQREIDAGLAATLAADDADDLVYRIRRDLSLTAELGTGRT